MSKRKQARKYLMIAESGVIIPKQVCNLIRGELVNIVNMLQGYFSEQ